MRFQRRAASARALAAIEAASKAGLRSSTTNFPLTITDRTEREERPKAIWPARLSPASGVGGS